MLDMCNIKLMRRKMKRIMAPALMWPAYCFAAHPLITDDTGTLGTSGAQMELSVDRARSTSGASFSRSRIVPRTEEVSTTSRSTLTNLAFTYGWTERVDIALSIPHQRVNATNADRVEGVGDTGIEMKWRFLEKDGVSIALKPQVLLPTGSERRELGNGKVSYGAIAVAAYEADQFMLLANAGYTYNNNVADARKDLWSVSAAAVWKMNPLVQLALDVGTYRNPDRSDNDNPAFAIIGLIYSPIDTLDLDVGIRKGLNQAEPDHAVGAGVTIRW